MKHILCLSGLFLLTCFSSFAQQATLKGKVIDFQNKPIAGVEILQLNGNGATFSDSAGRYSLVVKVVKPTKIRFRFTNIQYDTTVVELEMRPNYIYEQYVKMQEYSTDAVSIIGKNDRPQMQIVPIEVKESIKMPTVNPSVEALIISMPGVSGGNEFSSQYRVRGGNFDENLVYVNGIEVYRPFLARSGQMEGLGFANRNMTENIAFSTGGFAAQYGDKMSSVLDVTYRQPKSFAGSVELGAITNTMHLEGVSQNKENPDQHGKFTYLVGARYFALTYLLNSLEVRGNYKPRFMDLQGMFTYTPKRKNLLFYTERQRKDGTVDTLYFPLAKWKFTGFFTGSQNRYLFAPTFGESSFGTISTPLRLSTAFEGLEKTGYSTVLGAVMAENRPHTRLKFTHIISAFRTEESEKFDVEGGYRLSELNNNLASEEFGNESFVLGTGSIYRHARNYLTVGVLAAETKGEWLNKNYYNHKVYWGAKYEHHIVSDELKEYNLYDSAGYVVNPFYQFDITEYLKGSTNFRRNMLRFYVQEEWLFGKNQSSSLNYGMRLTYDDKIKLFMPSPRIQYSYDFAKVRQDLRLRLRLASGVYHQPPFYREFRRHDGSLNYDLTPQTAVHFIAGTDYTFNAWGRDFVLFSEAYYKYLYNLIPYEVQNVRLRYFPDYQLPGYAYGVDARLSGEFIRGVDSWMSASLLRTQERRTDTSSLLIPRPSDQRFTFSMYFQDELPINPTYKVHVNYVFGSGTRTSVPRNFLNRTAIQYPAYHRVDIGFSKMIIDRKPEAMALRKHGISSLWATLELYNLFGRFNTIAYEWVKDFDNNWFAVPQHLSARLLNVRLVVNFK